MDRETELVIVGYFTALRELMRKNNLIFGIVVNKIDPDDSRLAVIKKDTYRNEKPDGIQISLPELNKGLI